jgi:hypothetical protein
MKAQFPIVTGMWCVLALTLEWCTSVSASESHVPGRWVAGSMSNTNAFCVQQWTCQTPAVLTNPTDTVSITPDTSTSGTCSADGGPPDSCNACIGATEPATVCEVVVTSPDKDKPAAKPGR